MQVNEQMFEYLFMEVVNYTLNNSVSKETNEPDQEITFYKIERLGFAVGTRIMERYTLP